MHALSNVENIYRAFSCFVCKLEFYINLSVTTEVFFNVFKVSHTVLVLEENKGFRAFLIGAHAFYLVMSRSRFAFNHILINFNNFN